MNTKTKTLIKNLIGGMYSLIGLGAIGLTVFLLRESRNSVSTDAIWFYVEVLALLLAICTGLGYGLFRSKRWVYTLHTGLMILWIPFISLVSLNFSAELWYRKDIVWMLLVIVAIGLPITIQWFLRRNRDLMLQPPGSIKVWVKLIIVGIVTLPGFILVPIMAIGVDVYEFGSDRRHEVAGVETENYRVTLYHYPDLTICGEEFMKLVSVDKNSFLKGEKRVWSEDSYGAYKVAFVDTHTVGLFCPGFEDTILVDLLAAPDVIDNKKSHPRWHVELNYEGCTDKVVAENERFLVTWRTYPPLLQKYGGATRLLLRDKSAWFIRDKILIDAWGNDTVGANFIKPDSLIVFIHLLDDYHHQHRKHGTQSIHTFDLEHLPEYPVTY